MARRPDRGFTLIELMIVVAIIAILLSVAIPKFGNMLIRTKESATKGSLGAIRSAISIYYSDNEGRFPGAGGLDSSLTSAARYLASIPAARVPAPGDHPSSTNVLDYLGAYTDAGDWMYTAISGGINVNCTHLDSTGHQWTSW
jgi:prepilin-type N-terminal cleavage/methylation domain-containing protein